MAEYRFTLHEDRLAPGGYVELATPAANRALYAVDGNAGFGEMQSIERDGAALCPGLTRIETGHTGLVALRWELAPAEVAEEVAEAGLTTALLLEQTIELPEDDEMLMRLDAVALEAGKADPPHILPGPSLRVLADGEVTVESGGRATPHRPGGAWFQDKGEEVSVEAADTGAALILRTAILPTTLKGQSAIFYAENVRGEATQDPPPSHVYLDAEIAL